MFNAAKNRHLKAYLENEYNIDIVKKFGAYLLVKDEIIIEFFYTLEEVHEFLEAHRDFRAILETNGIPEKLLKKWERKQVEPDDDELPDEPDEKKD